MQGTPQTSRPEASLVSRGYAHGARRLAIASLLTILWLIPLYTVNAFVGSKSITKISGTQSSTASKTGGSGAAMTQPSFRVASPDPAGSYVDPAFQSYYAAHAGAAQLGAPVTGALPIRQGWVQFFVSGALFRPDPHATSRTALGDLTDQLINEGVRDPATGVIRLPLLYALITKGSTLPIGGATSSLTYVKLRDATRPQAMVPAPTPTTTSDDIFIKEGELSGKKSVGHIIPQDTWAYLQRPDVMPNGWQAELGNPLSEALTLTVTEPDGAHHLLAQVFERGIVLADLDARDQTGAPTFSRQQAGVDYLRTLGPPALVFSANTRLWTMGDTATFTLPEKGQEIVHVGVNFPFTTTGESRWIDGSLWYRVRWDSVPNTGEGWIPASTATFTQPTADADASASFDALSPDLAQYMAGQGGNAAAVVYDVTRGVYYSYRPDDQFIMASSAKVPIMLTFLSMTESQGREPNDNEMYLLTTMIENSNNDSAQALFDEIGGAPAMDNFAHRVGVSGLRPNPDAWGWSTVSPMAMVRMLTLLHEGKVLTQQDRALALNLMQNIETDQQTGVGDTAPAGATVAMKDGWVPAPDDLWAMNSSGIVTVGKETYIVAVYTQHKQTLDEGWDITRHVAGEVGKLLT